MNEHTLSDERRLQLWHEFQAGGPLSTDLLSFDQREKEPWSFATRRNNLRYEYTPLFVPTPEDLERLKWVKIALDKNSVIGGHFITHKGDWKIRSVGGVAYCYGKSTQTIESVSGYVESYGTSTQTIKYFEGSAYSWAASTQTIGAVIGMAVSFDASTQTINHKW